jgi:hypothetical protein
MTFPAKLNDWGPMTVLMIVVAVIAMGIGGAVVVVNPDTLTFQQYLDDLKTFALAVAGLAGARGILGAGRSVAESNVQKATLATPAYPTPPGLVHDDVPPDEYPFADVGEDLPSDEEELIGEGQLPTDDEEFAMVAPDPPDGEVP